MSRRVNLNVSNDVSTGGPYVGQRVRRREDRRFLVGRSRFVADIKVPGMLYARILRSPVAHARIKHIDTTAATALPGVIAVIDARDTQHLARWGNRHTGWPVGDKATFADRKVRFVGDEIAAVLSVSPYVAQDAVELIDVEYEALPAVVDPEKGMQPGALLVHDELVESGVISSNVAATVRLRAGDIRQAENEADLVVSGRFYCNRPVCNPLETHGSLALWDEVAGELTVWSSTQTVTWFRDGLADILGLPSRKVRIIVPDVGGGFGVKVPVFSHDVVAALFAMRTGRPVQILLDRSEELLACASRCAQIRYSELFLKNDGQFLGWRERIIQDQGAYAYSGNSVLQMGTQLGILPYKFPHVSVDGYMVYTNKVSGAAYRAYGVPQTSFARDSLVHMAAQKLGCQPEDLMMRNIVRGRECPITMSLGQKIDSTGVDACLEKAIAEVKRLGWRRDRSCLRGIGFSTTLKHSSARHPRMDYDHDSVRVCMLPDGGVVVTTATCPQGQGIETMLAQVAADQLGVGIDSILVSTGDSNGPRGLGTWGARTAVIVGNALVRACTEVRRRLVRVAAHVLEASEADLVVTDGAVSLGGSPQRKVLIKDLVALCERRARALPPGMEAGPIDITASYDSPTSNPDANGVGNPSVTYSGAAHACYLEVDRGTGKVTILDYVMAEDSGVAINPLIVEGQHQGAVAMALGQVLYEGLQYDQDGQPLNGNFRDYYVPLSSDLPDLSKVHDCGVPSTATLLGQRGAGETGNPPPMAAVANAIEDATGLRFTEMPITPEKILLALCALEDGGERGFDAD